MNHETYSGDGEHAYFYVEKVGLNTTDVVRSAADALNLSSVDLGYAGRKDKHGVTRQWISARTQASQWPAIPGTKCLTTSRHNRKLRVGALAGNSFKIVLREPTVCLAELERLFLQGYPNVFGQQRVSASNVQQALLWLERRQTQSPDDRRKNRRRGGGRHSGTVGWHMSVLRSLLFNHVLATRLDEYSGMQVLEGDVLVAGFPSAPLWGRGRSATQGEALSVEVHALTPHRQICEGLEFTGLQQGRRAMWVKPRQGRAKVLSDGAYELQFYLPAGAYATGLLSFAASP